jgi:hypothetical protein
MDVKLSENATLINLTVLMDKRDHLQIQSQRANLHLLIALIGFIVGLVLCQVSAWVFGGLLLVFSGGLLVYLVYFKLQARLLIENLNQEIQSHQQLPSIS